METIYGPGGRIFVSIFLLNGRNKRKRNGDRAEAGRVAPPGGNKGQEAIRNGSNRNELLWQRFDVSINRLETDGKVEQQSNRWPH